MNALAKETQLQVAHLLAEGNSIRSIDRLTTVHRDTIMKLLVRVGGHCRDFLDLRLRGLKLEHLEIDEIWTFVRKKQGRIRVDESDRGVGDYYLFVALDEETKLVPCYALGKRNGITCAAFLRDLHQRLELGWTDEERVQMSTDGWTPYRAAIPHQFGDRARHGVLIKDYRNADQPGRYGPPELVGAQRIPMDPDLDENDICTSHVERGNLTIRTFIKRFARLSLGFSKKLENLGAAVALYVAYYNFCKRHATLRRTPAMAAGLTGHQWTLLELLEAR